MSTVKKCIVWDLDNTLWDGICLEGDVVIRPEVQQTIKELDRRGILHSIASRGEKDVAVKILQEHKLEGYFLAPRINWLPKSTNIVRIAKEIRLSLESIAFIDDDRFELEQIAFMLPEVMTIEAQQAPELPYMSEFTLAEVTREARARRQFYQAEQQRKRAECQYPTREDFLKSCVMQLKVRSMNMDDVPRVLELMSRTHQLNTTGRIFLHDELLDIFSNRAGSMKIKVADLTDRFGWYGTIGVAITEASDARWRLLYLAISCRVLGRGIERAFLASLLRDAQNLGFDHAEAAFRDTGRNRMMRALYQMSGFRKWGKAQKSGTLIFRGAISEVPKTPSWVDVV